MRSATPGEVRCDYYYYYYCFIRFVYDLFIFLCCNEIFIFECILLVDYFYDVSCLEASSGSEKVGYQMEK